MHIKVVVNKCQERSQDQHILSTPKRVGAMGKKMHKKHVFIETTSSSILRVRMINGGSTQEATPARLPNLVSQKQKN